MNHHRMILCIGLLCTIYQTALSQNSIDVSSLPAAIEDTPLVEVQLQVESETEADLVIDILDDQNWYGGGRIRIEPGNNLVSLSVPIFVAMPQGSNYFWNTFLTTPGDDYSSAIVFGPIRPITVQEEVSVNTNDVQITSYSHNAATGQVDVIIDYSMVNDGHANVNLFDDQNQWRAGNSIALSAGQGEATVSIDLPFELDSSEYTFHNYLSENSSDWQNALVWGPIVTGQISQPTQTSLTVSLPVPTVSLGQNPTIDLQYSVDTNSDIVFDIFDNTTDQWLSNQRMINVSGINSSSVEIASIQLLPGSYRIHSFITSRGGDWTTASVFGEPQVFNVEAGDVSPGILTSKDITFPLDWIDAQGNPVSEDRLVQIRVPQGADEKTPVVIMFHGSYGTAQGMLNTYNYLGDRILVSCQGYNNDWNISFDAHQGPDVDFVRQLITQLRTYNNVDADQITLLGWSNGTGLVNRLLIELEADWFQTAICLSQQLRYIQYNDDNFRFDPNGRWDYTDTITPAQGRRILTVHGESDQVLFYDGHPNTDIDLWYTNLESVNIWANAMGYTGPELTEADGIDDPESVKYSFLNGQVAHYQIKNANHNLETPGFGTSKTQAIILEFLNQ